MFDNRAYGWKLGVALALIVGACVWSDRNGEDINPEYWRCMLRQDKFAGETIWIPGVVVQEVSEEGFWILRGVKGTLRVHVTGEAARGVKAGQRVGVRATFRPDKTLEAVMVEPVPAPVSRLVLNLISLGVILLVIAYFLFHYRIRWDRIVLREKDA